MPEEGLETQDLKEQLESARENAEKAGEERLREEKDTRWLTLLSLSTALLAALAAFASLKAGGLANEALLLKSEAVLAESGYADNWSEYQSRSIKAYLFETQAALAAELAKKDALDHAQHEHAEADKLKPVAAELRKKVNDLNTASSEHLERHEVFAKTVTLFQISIAVAAIAALTKKRAMWWLSLLGGAFGLALLVSGLSTGGEHGQEASGHSPAGAATAPTTKE